MSQLSQGISEAPARFADAGADAPRVVRRAFAMEEFVPRLPRPIPDRPLVNPNPPPPDPRGSTPCNLNLNHFANLATTLGMGWMVVHGRIASTPARRELRIPAPGLHMPSTLIRTWQFEIIPTAVCGGGSSLPERNLIVNHWDEKFSQTDDNALTRTESNPLDGRPNHAVVADGRERILVLAPDQTARGQWLLMASLDVEDGLLLEDALDHPRLATAAAVMNQCRIAANRGGQ